MDEFFQFFQSITFGLIFFFSGLIPYTIRRIHGTSGSQDHRRRFPHNPHYAPRHNATRVTVDGRNGNRSPNLHHVVVV